MAPWRGVDVCWEVKAKPSRAYSRRAPIGSLSSVATLKVRLVSLWVGGVGLVTLLSYRGDRGEAACWTIGRACGAVVAAREHRFVY